MRKKFRLILLLACFGFSSVHAGAMLESTAKLSPMIRKAPEVLLVDARSETSRRRQPLDNATQYRESMTVKAGLVVVVAENDQRALQVARQLASQSDSTVYAVKGGASAWREMTDRNRKSLQSLMPSNFVIPHNTCEQGSALQEYRK